MGAFTVRGHLAMHEPVEKINETFKMNLQGQRALVTKLSLLESWKQVGLHALEARHADKLMSRVRPQLACFPTNPDNWMSGSGGVYGCKMF